MLLALLERGLGDIEQQISVLQLDVGMRDAGGEREARSLGVHRACARKSERALIGGALLAPEIQFPAERGLQVAHVVVLPAKGGGKMPLSDSRSRVASADRLACGARAASLTPASASAARVRAAATLSVGLSRSPSRMS